MPYTDKQKAKECMAAYLQTDKGKADHNRATANYRKRNPEKYKATTAVNNALRDGILTRPDCCEECGSNCKPHGHHDDYEKKLEVRWLCNDCHNNWHLEND